MTLCLGNDPIAGIATNTKYNANNLLDFKWVDHLLSDQSWLRADTFSWQLGSVYVTAYNHLVQDLRIIAETETIGSYTVTFYRATDGHKICLADQETTVLNIYNETGVAWYYILDTTNTQFKLPRTKYGFEGLRTNVGDKIDESLPNIIGHTGYGQGESLYSGAFYKDTSNPRTWVGGYTTITDNNAISFSANKSNSTYQDNAPVQERATQMYLYFYVGEFSQTATEQTAGLNAELFNNKVDLNLANVSNTGTSLGASWAIPSNVYENITIGASGATYTAPANGHYEINSICSNGNTYVQFINQRNNEFARIQETTTGVWTPTLIMPVLKGDVVELYYYNLDVSEPSNGRYFRFYYAEGSKGEA